jgi:putative FmdB family regulatory protein
VPTYQYACTACDERLEAVQSFTDAPLTECPACGGALRKVFSAVGVVFKGSGFYKTDSRTSPKSGSADKGDKGTGDKGTGDKGTGDKGTGDKAATPASTSSSTDAKPAAAPAAKPATPAASKTA